MLAHEIVLDAVEHGCGLVVVEDPERPDQAELGEVALAARGLLGEQVVQRLASALELGLVEVQVVVVEGAHRLESGQHGTDGRRVSLGALLPYTVVLALPPA